MDSEEIDVEIPSLQSENAPLVKVSQPTASQQQNDETFSQNAIRKQEEARESAEKVPATEAHEHEGESTQKNVPATDQEQKHQESSEMVTELSEEDEVAVEVPVNEVVESQEVKPRVSPPQQLPLSQVPIEVPERKLPTWTQKATPSQCALQPSSDNSAKLKLEEPKVPQEAPADRAAVGSAHQNEESTCPDEVDVEFDLASAYRSYAGRMVTETVQRSITPVQQTAAHSQVPHAVVGKSLITEPSSTGSSKGEKPHSVSVRPGAVLNALPVPEQEVRTSLRFQKEPTTHTVVSEALSVKSPLKREAKLLSTQNQEDPSLASQEGENDEDDDDDDDDDA